MVFLHERIGRLIDDLGKLVYPFSVDIENYRMARAGRELSNISSLDALDWVEFSHNLTWGGHREYYAFDAVVEIPRELAGKCVEYELSTGREGLWDATNPQFTIYIDGVRTQGLDVNHRSVILSENAEQGRKYRITLTAFTGDKNYHLILKSSLRIVDREIEKYYYDLKVPFDAACLLDRESPEYIKIILSLNESLNLLDLREEYSQSYYTSLKVAQKYLDSELYAKNSSGEPVVFCIGHTHIDVAWLWTLDVTEDKSVRSFSTVLELMKRYPEYIFMSSQPQLYKYVKQNAPEIYAQIKERVKEGRWEADGGMWVEADCNIASGEALVRQFLYGTKFFREEFGKECDILWLPDVFGYSAALPQIMHKCGVKYFMTTKISWNEFNKLPYDTFMWEGIDGTSILSHFMPTRDYLPGLDKYGRERTAHFTTYNGYLNPSQVKGAWKRYQQKHINNDVLMAFGYGDGGGGPTSDMLENYRRLNSGIPGTPKTVMTTAGDYFRKLEADVSGNKYLPSWVGELYLEYHRGTYTSMARNKKFNRKSEFAALNAEFYSVLAERFSDLAYPKDSFDAQWVVILRNQFHDILPGSSIKEVYDDSKAEYEGVFAELGDITGNALGAITDMIDAESGSIIAFNPNSFDFDDIVTSSIPDGITNPIVMDGSGALDTQVILDGRIVFKANSIPNKGYKAFSVCDRGGAPVKSGISLSPREIDTPMLNIKLNDKGQFISIFDKEQKRELLKAGEHGNVLMAYEDRPHNYDAWDVNNYYTEKSWEISGVNDISVVEDGPVRYALKISRSWLSSTITQYIYIYPHTKRIDIKNEIDWKEKQIFVKILFPLDIHSSTATFDIQYGNVERPTHYNTSWDFARFEVCFHKWLDISESGYGVSFLSESKYGCSVHDGIVGISALKSAIYPNPDADKEFHEFTFSVYPHTGGWRDADTVREAYSLNNPITCAIKTNSGGKLPRSYGFVRPVDSNIIVEAVKKAEDGNGVIVRLYECHNRRTSAQVEFGGRLAAINECDMLERPCGNISFDGNTAAFTMLPYEIKTLRVVLEALE